MMPLSLTYKVPGGKMIRVQARVEGGRIAKVRITGDFFLLPEHAIEDLEKMLRGLPTDTDFKHLMADFFEKEKVMAAGLTAEDLALALMRVFQGGTGPTLDRKGESPMTITK